VNNKENELQTDKNSKVLIKKSSTVMYQNFNYKSNMAQKKKNRITLMTVGKWLLGYTYKQLVTNQNYQDVSSNPYKKLDYKDGKSL
jgi:hypothetical protein